MDINFSKFSSKMQLALAAIGRTGATAYPFNEQDPLDKVLYEFYVGKIAASFFTNRSRKELSDILSKELSAERQSSLIRMVQKARQQQSKQEANILVTPNFTFNVSINKPAPGRIKAEKLKAILSKQGWTLKKIEALIDECTEMSEPAKTFTSVPSES